MIVVTLAHLSPVCNPMVRGTANFIDAFAIRGLVRFSDMSNTRKRHPPIRELLLATNLIGCLSMVPPAMLQLGLVKHLPDPPLDGFDSDKVNLSPDAFPAGVPDGPVAFTSFAMNLYLLKLGRESRGWRSIVAAKSGLEALVALRYLYLMPTRERAWCPYCVLGAAAVISSFLLSIAWMRKRVNQEACHSD